MKQKNKPRPSNMEVSIFCKYCNKRDKLFMTSEEISNKTIIKQPCKKCKRFTEWVLK